MNKNSGFSFRYDIIFPVIGALFSMWHYLKIYLLYFISLALIIGVGSALNENFFHFSLFNRFLTDLSNDNSFAFDKLSHLIFKNETKYGIIISVPIVYLIVLIILRNIFIKATGKLKYIPIIIDDLKQSFFWKLATYIFGLTNFFVLYILFSSNPDYKFPIFMYTILLFLTCLLYLAEYVYNKCVFDKKLALLSAKEKDTIKGNPGFIWILIMIFSLPVDTSNVLAMKKLDVKTRRIAICLSSLKFLLLICLSSIIIQKTNKLFFENERINIMLIFILNINALITNLILTEGEIPIQKDSSIPNNATDFFQDDNGIKTISDNESESVTIPNSVTNIGNEVFRGCSDLKSITIPNSVTSIGEWAFRGCSGLKSITIPNSVTSIGEWAFSDCTSLKSITIPNSVTSIGDGAFSYCFSLKSITIPNSVTSIGDGAFSSCSSLESITIPNSVTSIGRRVFEFCSSLVSITIPNSVTGIGEGAFSACSSLESITIPNSVASIADEAFLACSSLTSVKLSRKTKVGGRVFYGAIITYTD